MKRWRLLLIGLSLLLLVACGSAAWRTVFGAPLGFVPPDAADVQVHKIDVSSYQVTYRAASPLRDWRLATIQRLTAEGWSRGRQPDSPRFDRSLWFVRRQTIGVLSVLEQVSFQAGDDETPLVILTYRQSISAPAVERWLPR